MQAKLSLLLATLLVSGALTGCLAGINTLTGGAGEDAARSEDLDQGSIDDVTDNVTDDVDDATDGNLSDKKPPVARIRVNDATGALVHETKIDAADQLTIPVVFNAGPATFSASDSNARDGAKIESYEWVVEPGPILASGRTVTLDLSKPAAYTVTLTVKDNNNLTDTQGLLLHVMPVPFVVAQVFTGSITAGAEYIGVPANPTHPFTVLATNEAGSTLKVVGAKVSVKPTGTLAAAQDMALRVTGTDLDESTDSTGSGVAETLSFSGLAAGDYVAEPQLYSGVNAEYELVVEVTYLEVVEGLGGGDGHGHAH
ncbi:MAG TPA: PKD domain-containing protein [Candidatus Thermoplasmatota archaeon]|nr:PKD domain-containing protein [Candidatus Thermoplasmatota archaeon]